MLYSEIMRPQKIKEENEDPMLTARLRAAKYGIKVVN